MLPLENQLLEIKEGEPFSSANVDMVSANVNTMQLMKGYDINDMIYYYLSYVPVGCMFLPLFPNFPLKPLHNVQSWRYS